MTKRHKPPEQSPGDHLHTLARAGIGVIPGISGPALELFNMLIKPPLERRRQRWMEDVAQALRDLEEQKSLRLEDLASNETFITTMMQASQAAIRNHQNEKIVALRNAVLNAALPSAPDDSLQQMFLSFVDDLSDWHLRVLALLNDPPGWFKRSGRQVPEFYAGSRSQLVTTAYPDLAGHQALFGQVARDLYGRGLLGTDSFAGMMTGDGMIQSITTDLGKQFLRFIEDPRVDV